MKFILAAAAFILFAGCPALAHRLDQYLQGTLISIGRNRVDAQMTLTPGVAVFPALIADIDLNGDGVISEIEQRAYSQRILGDVSISIDGHPLAPRLLSAQFPQIAEMKDGRGEIRIEFDAELPSGGPSRKLTFENHHQSRIAAYQVNCLVSSDPDIRILAQSRNYSQSFYQLEFAQSEVRSEPTPVSSGAGRPLGAIALIAAAMLALLLRARLTAGADPSKSAHAVPGNSHSPSASDT
jgi:hypothetical protein